MAAQYGELGCRLCSGLLSYPLSLPCGHSFCKLCLSHTIDYRGECPTCGSCCHLDIYEALPSTVLESIIEDQFPDIKKVLVDLEDIPRFLPLFALQCEPFPSKSIFLHIFEPRYRLLLKRALLGSRAFGFIESSYINDTTIGISARVIESELLPDGRSLIKTQCERRFKVLEDWQLDEYIVGRVEYFKDEPLPESKLQGCKELFTQIEPVLDDLINATYNTQVEVLLHDRPIQLQTVNDISLETLRYMEAYSFWLCSFLNLNSDLRFYLLSLTNTYKRLELLASLYPRALRNPSKELSLVRAAPTA